MVGPTLKYPPGKMPPPLTSGVSPHKTINTRVRTATQVTTTQNANRTGVIFQAAVPLQFEDNVYINSYTNMYVHSDIADICKH